MVSPEWQKAIESIRDQMKWAAGLSDPAVTIEIIGDIRKLHEYSEAIRELMLAKNKCNKFETSL